MPTVQWRLPGSASHSASTAASMSSVGAKKKGKKGGSCLFNIVELIFFVIWLIFTGITGYYFGYDPNSIKCPEVKASLSRNSEISRLAGELKQAVQSNHNNAPAPCASKQYRPEIYSSDFPENGYSYEELKAIWHCSHAVGNTSNVNKDIMPSNLNLQKTKWKSIITVEPKAFFDKYLSQYPGDTRATQPVLIFSHKPLQSFEEVGDVCKVLDVAVVPDRPGVCVAVTETYHDVASYHMLHAEKTSSGKYALTANFVDGRVLPEETHYSIARNLLLQYFKYNEQVMDAMKDVPKYGNGKVTVGVFVDNAEELELFLNSYASAKKKGVSNNKFAVFTTSEQVKNDMSKTGIKVLYFPQLASLGKDIALPEKYRRYFLQAWMAFSAANALVKMMWASPGSIWMERPDNIVKAFPVTELSWSFKGRRDKRAAPFYISFDFFVAIGVERPIHFLHELILHFDLIMAWDSLDAVASYRLTENNSRYGTTTFILPPYKVLHTELMDHDANKVKEAVDAEDKPFVVIVPVDYENSSKTKQVLMDSGLWFL